MNLPLSSALPSWVLNRRVRNVSSSTLPGRTSRKRAEPPVVWTPSLVPVQARKLRSLGTQTGHPQLRGITEETGSCEESVLGHDEISGRLKINAFAFHCSEKPLKKMLFPIETGVARSRTPSRGAMMLPKSRKPCSRGQGQC